MVFSFMNDKNKKTEAMDGDRVTALLALGVEKQPPQTGGCLSPEELSCLIENKCSQEEKSRLFKHISTCASCYNRWLALASICDEQTGVRGKIFPLSSAIKKRPLFYIWGPSLLAAAASVLLYVNIDIEQDMLFLSHQSLETSVTEEAIMADELSSSMPESFLLQSEPVQEKTKSAHSAARSLPEITYQKNNDMNVDAITGKGVQKDINLSEAVDKNKLLGREDNISTAITKSKMPIDSERWINEIKRKCRDGGGGDREFWKIKLEQGESLGRQVAKGKRDEEEQILNQEIMVLVERLSMAGNDKRYAICKELENIISKGHR